MPVFFSLGPLQAQEGRHYHTLMAGLFHPLSHGSSHIASSDPLVPPAIDPGFLSNEFDLELLLALVKFCRTLVATAPYASAVVGAYDPPASVQSDAELKEWIKNTVQPFYHPVSTAPLLPREKGGVVDVNLKVYGTKNLRVVSILSVLCSALLDTSLIRWTPLLSLWCVAVYPSP